MSPRSRTEAAEPRHEATASAATPARHLVWGWFTLLVFISLGLVLEALHGLKVGAYLDVSNETRRLMWTLAHAHGTLIALIHLAFASTLRHREGPGGTHSKRLSLASRSLKAATVLMPAGFFLGGAYLHDGDPGLGVFLVPPGGLLLAVAVACIAFDLIAETRGR